jgi:hypothetical protein
VIMELINSPVCKISLWFAATATDYVAVLFICCNDAQLAQATRALATELLW